MLDGSLDAEVVQLTRRSRIEGDEAQPHRHDQVIGISPREELDVGLHLPTVADQEVGPEDDDALPTMLFSGISKAGIRIHRNLTLCNYIRAIMPIT